MNESKVIVNGNGQVTAWIGRDATSLFQLRMILIGLQAEVNGMRLTRRAPSCLSICKKRFGMKGSRDSIIEQVKVLIAEKSATLEVVKE